MGPKLGDLRWISGGVEDPVPRCFQFPHYLNERNAIQPGGQIVKQLGRLSIVKRGQFLHFAEFHGKNVVENRLVDIREQ